MFLLPPLIILGNHRGTLECDDLRKNHEEGKGGSLLHVYTWCRVGGMMFFLPLSLF